MNIEMKFLTLTVLGILGFVLSEVEKKTRGPGSWAVDRWILRCQGALLCAALYAVLS